jgi:hypothetical protein
VAAIREVCSGILRDHPRRLDEQQARLPHCSCVICDGNYKHRDEAEGCIAVASQTRKSDFTRRSRAAISGKLADSAMLFGEKKAKMASSDQVSFVQTHAACKGSIDHLVPELTVHESHRSSVA